MELEDKEFACDKLRRIVEWFETLEDAQRFVELSKLN